MSCAKCSTKPTDGMCCPEPIRYWTHSADGRDIQYATAVVPLATYWCDVHRWACSEPCQVCDAAARPELTL